MDNQIEKKRFFERTLSLSFKWVGIILAIVVVIFSLVVGLIMSNSTLKDDTITQKDTQITNVTAERDALKKEKEDKMKATEESKKKMEEIKENRDQFLKDRGLDSLRFGPIYWVWSEGNSNIENAIKGFDTTPERDTSSNTYYVNYRYELKNLVSGTFGGDDSKMIKVAENLVIKHSGVLKFLYKINRGIIKNIKEYYDLEDQALDLIPYLGNSSYETEFKAYYEWHTSDSVDVENVITQNETWDKMTDKMVKKYSQLSTEKDVMRAYKNWRSVHANGLDEKAKSDLLYILTNYNNLDQEESKDDVEEESEDGKENKGKKVSISDLLGL